MPSPVGHALGGLIVGYSLGTRRLTLLAIAAIGPDLDFLWGRHSMETHSLTAAAAVGLIAFAATRGREPRFAVAVALAWASHILFDWLGSDTTPPLGVMALWPLSSEYYFSNAFFFEAISRRYWLDNFITHNLWAVAREILILGPVLALVMAVRWRGRRRSRHPGTA